MLFVKLSKKESTFGLIRTTAEEFRLFSTQEKAEDWLRANNFSYRPITFYQGDPLWWSHENAVAWQHVDVEFIDLDVDSEAESMFKNMERKSILMG